MSFEGMPLCCPAHITMGWRYLNSYMVLQSLYQGRVSPAELAEAKDRVILAAIEHGLIDPADGRSWRLP